MFAEGIFPIGDGLLDIDETRLKGLLVQDDINEIYDVEQTPFARGKFAAVRRAIHKNSGVHFAAKFLKRRRRAQSSDKEIKHEIAVLMLCDGAENIVKLNAVHESRSDTALLLELATGGELQTFLDNEECLSEAQTRICMREVLRAIQFLHNRSIAHLDLKPQNILLAGEHIEDGLKLCDFGISRVVAEGTNVREIVGTPDYVAPEVLQYEPLSLLTDIWSVGVLAYVLLTGFSPFGGDTKQETFLNISQCALTFPDKLFGGVSAPAIDFIRRALRIKPSDRMSAAGCLEHIWLKDECCIDRQMFGISKTTTANAAEGGNLSDDDDDDDVDDEIDDEEVEEDEEDEDEDGPDESYEEELYLDDDEAGTRRSFCNGIRNGVVSVTNKALLSKGTPAVAICSDVSNGRSKKTATAIIALPAAVRATTMPSLTVPTAAAAATAAIVQQQHQQQQQHLLHIAARRHSADANKENTFVAAKKVAATTPSDTLPATAAATATALIGNSNTLPATNVALNSASDKHIGNSNCCNFPDAPTTPKVIRKATTTDNAATSVKALVKKFQLEVGSDGTQHAPATTTAIATAGAGAVHLKESLQQNQQQPQPQQQEQQQQQQQQQHIGSNNHARLIGAAQRRAAAAATATNSRKSTTTTTTTQHNTSTTTACCNRSCSNCVVAAMMPPSPSAAAVAGNSNNKMSCAYCLASNSSSNNSSSSGGAVVAVVAATASPPFAVCRHTMMTPTSNHNASNNSSTAAAILLSNHKQLQHHHHHHHHQHHHHATPKNGANGLSLDQGIIC